MLSKMDEASVLLEHSSGWNKMNTQTKKGKSKQRLVESDVQRVGDSSSAVQLMVGTQFGVAT